MHHLHLALAAGWWQGGGRVVVVMRHQGPSAQVLRRVRPEAKAEEA